MTRIASHSAHHDQAKCFLYRVGPNAYRRDYYTARFLDALGKKTKPFEVEQLLSGEPLNPNLTSMSGDIFPKFKDQNVTLKNLNMSRPERTVFLKLNVEMSHLKCDTNISNVTIKHSMFDGNIPNVGVTF